MTIFRKQFLMYIGTVVFSFVVLGIVLSQAMNAFYRTQTTKRMQKQGYLISEALSNEMVGYGRFGSFFDYDFDVNTLGNEMNRVLMYTDLSVVLTDSEFNVIMASSDLISQEDIMKENVVIINNSEDVKNGKIVSQTGNLGGISKEKLLTVAYPLIKNNQVQYVLFMCSSLPELQDTIYEMTRIIIICLLAAGIIAFAMIYFSARAITKPLKEMTGAAREIAGGDFAKRLVVKSNDETAQLAKSFNDMAESLSMQEMRRREFIANISHDLRSPLTSMKGFLEAITDGTIPQERHQHYIEIVLDETERLSKLANDILLLNQANDPVSNIEYSIFDINELIRSTVSSFEGRAAEKDIRIQLLFDDGMTSVHADYNKIQRVLYNLLDNAVKFVKNSGHIQVEVKVNIIDKIWVFVRDDGPGVSRDDRMRIFDRFYKSDISRGEDKKGSGLGLSIVKEFIRAHNENLMLRSEPGKGCEFSFSLAPAGDRKSR